MTKVVRRGEKTVLYQEEEDEGMILFRIQMRDGENRMTPAMNGELVECLDLVLEGIKHKNEKLKAALILQGEGKYFSLGLDLSSYYEAAAKRKNIEAQRLFEESYQYMVAKLMAFPLLTIAAINGHAIAGGMVLALACDIRIMNARRGLLAMNEIHLPASLPSGMMAVVKSRIADAQLQRNVLLLGRRFTSVEMHKAGLIDQLVEDDDQLLQLAKEMAIKNAHDIGKTSFLELIKKVQLKDTLNDLLQPERIDHFALARHAHYSKL